MKQRICLQPYSFYSNACEKINVGDNQLRHFFQLKRVSIHENIIQFNHQLF